MTNAGLNPSETPLAIRQIGAALRFGSSIDDRIDAARKLETMGDELNPILRAVVLATCDRVREVRHRAYAALLRAGDAAIAELRTMLSMNEWDKRCIAANVLMHFKERARSALPELLSILRNSAEIPEVIQPALRVVAVLPSLKPTDHQTLQLVLDAYFEVTVREPAREALGALLARTAIPRELLASRVEQLDELAATNGGALAQSARLIRAQLQ